MKRFVMAAVAALSFSAPFSTVAHANGCDAPTTGFDNVYCFAKVYMDLDKQLNDNYIALMHMLNQGQKPVLRDGQRDWIAMRNQRCLRVDGQENNVSINCALSTTRRRIQFLSDRLAECRATGCNMTKLRHVTEMPDG